MNQIKFSHNWNNKLNNDIFTTIRSYTQEKFIYYDSKVGEQYGIILNHKVKCNAQLFRIQVKKYIEIPQEVLVLDTGETDFISIQTIFEKFGMKDINDKMIVLWFKKSTKD